MSTVLLDHHQDVLGMPSEGNTSPCTLMQLPATCLQHHTWNLPGETARVPDIQGIENFLN